MFRTEISVTREQYECFMRRSNRSFEKRYTKENILGQLGKTKDVHIIGNIAEKYGLCDYADFSGLNTDTADMLIKSVVKVTYLFPRVRSRVCFLGSKTGYFETLKKLYSLDRAVIRKIGIDGILPDSFIRDMAKNGIDIINNTEYNGTESNLLAQAFSLGSIFDGVIVDEADFSGFGYIRLCKNLQHAKDYGINPVGCDKPESVILHEFGHLLDYLCDLCHDISFLRYYNGLSSNEIKSKLSEYATTNSQEFIAEAFAECMCNPHPREMAMKVWALLVGKYNKL